MYTIMVPFLLYGEPPVSFTPLSYGSTGAVCLHSLQANTLLHDGANVMSFTLLLPCGSNADAICQCRWAIAYGAPGGDGEPFMKCL